MNAPIIPLFVFIFATLIPVDLILGEEPGAPRFSKPEVIYYEFGLKITSNGQSSGILGTVPVPIEWPEQKVEFIEQRKSDSLKNISFKKLGKNIRQMVIKANRLEPGEVAEGTVVLKIKKCHIQTPEDTSNLVIAKKIPGSIRQYLKPSPYIESNHRTIKKLVKKIPLPHNLSDWKRIETIYQWVRDNIEYKFDEQIHSCLTALESGQGDCEELSSLFIAICRAQGIPARAVWIPGHTYPEFYLEDKNGNGYWFPCQAAGTYQFGEMEESRPILQKGDRFKLPGNPKTLRYVQPSLVAKEATAGLSIEFIARQVTDEFESGSLSSKVPSSGKTQ
ncbi:MAG: transglutaminase-like domain-containing protein [Planctomycetota bacterium]